MPNGGNASSLKDANFPIGIGYIASVLVEAKHDVKVYDLQYEKIIGRLNKHRLAEIIKENAHDVVCAGGVFMDLNSLIELITVSKKINPNIPVVVGGSFCNSLPEVIFDNTLADYIVVGEGETTIVELISNLESSQPQSLESICGIMYRTNDGRMKKTAPLSKVIDIDDIPFPKRDLFLFEEVYRKRFAIPNSMRYSADILGSRGCPSTCTFCGSPFGKNVRVRKTENILEEIELLQADYDIKNIRFIDEMLLGGSKKHIRDFCEKVICRRMSFSWSGEILPNKVDFELLKLMKRANCLYLVVGLESASPRILKEIKKPNNLEHFKKVVQWCGELDFALTINVISGTFSETPETLAETKSYLLLLNQYQFHNIIKIDYIVPIPGTRLHDDAKKRGYIKMSDFEYIKKMPDFNRSHCNINLTSMDSQYYTNLIKQINREISDDYYKRRPLQRIRGKLGLLGCQFQKGLSNFKLRDLFPFIRSIAWGMSKGKHNFIGSMLQKIVFGRYYRHETGKN